jgi:hypothetical protein
MICISVAFLNRREQSLFVDFLTKQIDSAKLFAAIDQALRRDAEQRSTRTLRFSKLPICPVQTLNSVVG